MGEQGISCPKFQKREPAVNEATEGINQAEGRGKVEWAQKLKKEVEPLLACEDYSSDDLGCRSCRVICQTRARAAEVIIKAFGSLS